MQKRFEIASAHLIQIILLSMLIAQASFARPVENDDSGYLSKNRYDLSSSRAIKKNSAHVQIVDNSIDADAPDKPFELKASFSTNGKRTEDDNVEATTSTTVIGVEMAWNFTKWLRANFLGGYQFASGNAAIVYGIETSPYTGASFDEGSFTVTAVPGLEISAGVVNTEFNAFSSTFAGTGFAGLRETYSFENGSFFGSIKGFQVAPSSMDQANRAIDDEKNPFLTVANINLGFKTEQFKTGIGFTKYDFYGMTSASAGDSRYLGNTVIGEGNNIVNYKYKFRGQELSGLAEMTLRLDDKLGVSGNMTKNDDADAKRNFGWMSKSYYEFNFGRYSIKPSVIRFRFEPDLMPAFFSHGGLGYMNRDGYAGEIRAAFKKYNLESYVRYLDAKEVEPNAVQSDRIGLTVGMEVKYEIL